jgi:hypothetical protein
MSDARFRRQAGDRSRKTLEELLEGGIDPNAFTDNQADGYKGDEDLGASPDDQADGFKGRPEDNEAAPPAAPKAPPPLSVDTGRPVKALKPVRFKGNNR